MVGLAVRAPLRLPAGKNLRESHVFASPESSFITNPRLTHGFMHPFETSHSARLGDFTKLAELSNREELYRPKNWRQYRIFRRKSFRNLHLFDFWPFRRRFFLARKFAPLSRLCAKGLAAFSATILTFRIIGSR